MLWILLSVAVYTCLDGVDGGGFVLGPLEKGSVLHVSDADFEEYISINCAFGYSSKAGFKPESPECCEQLEHVYLKSRRTCYGPPSVGPVITTNRHSSKSSGRKANEETLSSVAPTLSGNDELVEDAAEYLEKKLGNAGEQNFIAGSGVHESSFTVHYGPTDDGPSSTTDYPYQCLFGTSPTYGFTIRSARCCKWLYRMFMKARESCGLDHSSILDVTATKEQSYSTPYVTSPPNIPSDLSSRATDASETVGTTTTSPLTQKHSESFARSITFEDAFISGYFFYLLLWAFVLYCVIP